MAIVSARVGYVVAAGIIAIAGLGIAVAGPTLPRIGPAAALTGTVLAGILAGVPTANTEEGFYNGLYASLVAMALGIVGFIGGTALGGADVFVMAAGVFLLVVSFGVVFTGYALVLASLAAATAWVRTT